MAVITPEPIFNRVLPAAVDLSTSQFLYVGDNGADPAKYNVIGDDALGAFGSGFLQNTPLADEACEVMTVGGGAKALLEGTVAVQDELIAKANGKLIVAPGGAGTVSFIVAIAQEAGVTGDVIAVQPVLYTNTIET